MTAPTRGGTRPGAGRPKLPAEQKKTPLRIYLTGAEHEALARRARLAEKFPAGLAAKILGRYLDTEP